MELSPPEFVPYGMEKKERIAVFALIAALFFAVSACDLLPASPAIGTVVSVLPETAVTARPPGPASAELTYEDPALGIIFQYPSGWTLQTHPQEPVDLVLTSFDPANPPHKLAWDETTIKIGIRLIPARLAPAPLDQWMPYLAEEQHIDGSLLSLAGEERLTLPGGSALEHVTVVSGSGGVLHFAYLILGDKHLEFTVEGANFSLALGVIGSIRSLSAGASPASGLPQPGEGGDPYFLFALKNAWYHSPDWGDYQLVDGIHFRPPDSPGASPQLFSTQIFEPVAFGDLNADAIEDAAVILQTHNGGNGDTKELAAVLNQNGAAKNVSTVYLGSGIAVESMQIQSGVIILSLRVHGPDDGLCCPSQAETWQFRLEDELVRLP